MNKKTTRRALTMSVISLVICVAMLMGTTFAWFTDSVTSGRNTIVAGNLDVVLEYYVDGAFKEVTKTTALFNDSSLWEPGHTEVAYLKVSNAGTLALKYQLAVNVFNELAGTNVANESFKLSDHLVFKVVDIDEATAGTYTRDTAKTAAGTVMGLGEYNSGTKTLMPKGKGVDSACVALIVYMPETVGNEANYLTGTQAPYITMGTELVATQVESEFDSFGNDYDADAYLNFVHVSNANELKVALEAEKENIILTKNIESDEAFNVTADANINGAGFTVSRKDGYTGNLFNVKANATLTVGDMVIDGGAVWSSTFAAGSAPTNVGATATGNLIAAEKNSHIVLNEGAVVQNNDGAIAINLGTRVGATLTLNGGYVLNNRANGGAIWGGGNITVNEGSKINNNSSPGVSGAIRMLSKCTLTVNGGEICNNTAGTNGGAIYGYDASTYYFNGGKIAGNTAGELGGAIYPGTYSVFYISGDFELVDNTAKNGGAIRFTNHNSFNMTGGKVAGNVSTETPDWDGLYAYDTYVGILGGEFADDFTVQGGLQPQIGDATITGTAHFAVGTNRNGVNLAKDFGSLNFTVSETATNFANFHFEPAADYVYTEGDEDKLICLNAGYETYWDTATSTFRLQAK